MKEKELIKNYNVYEMQGWSPFNAFLFLADILNTECVKYKSTFNPFMVSIRYKSVTIKKRDYHMDVVSVYNSQEPNLLTNMVNCFKKLVEDLGDC